MEGCLRSIRFERLSVILAASCALSICLPQEVGGHRGQVAVKGRYINPDYGFSVRIPNQLPAYRLRSPAPQHGITLELDKDNRIWINAEYDALMLGSAEALAKRASQMYGDGLKTVSNSVVELSGLEARDVVLAGESDAGATNYVHLLAGYRSLTNAPGVAYTITLQGRMKNRASERLFETVCRSFRVTPISGRK